MKSLANDLFLSYRVTICHKKYVTDHIQMIQSRANLKQLSKYSKLEDKTFSGKC